MGDLGNLETDADGNIKAEFDDTQVSLVGPLAVNGRAFVVRDQSTYLAQKLCPCLRIQLNECTGSVQRWSAEKLGCAQPILVESAICVSHLCTTHFCCR